MDIRDDRDKRNLLPLKIHLEQEFFKKLEDFAKQKGVKIDDLVRTWIKERLADL